MSRESKFRVGRLDGDRFLVLHPDGRIIEVRGEIAVPFLRIAKGGRAGAVNLPEPMNSVDTEHDLGWLWEPTFVKESESRTYPVSRITPEQRREIARKQTERAMRKMGYGSW